MIHLLSLEFLEFILLCFAILASASLSELFWLLALVKFPTVGIRASFGLSGLSGIHLGES